MTRNNDDRPMTVESLIFGYPDHTIHWVEKILPILEKAGFKNLPTVVGQTVRHYPTGI